MSSLQLLNAIIAKATTPKTSTNRLMFIEAKVNGVATRALVDTGAFHNFMSIEESKRIGLKTTKEGGSLKAINSTAKPIHRIAKGVHITIVKWSGTIELSVVLMDDFKMVLGMEFFDKVTDFPLSFTNLICIINGKNTCMIMVEQNVKVKTKALSTMQFKKEF